jgi:hypothetical protein
MAFRTNTIFGMREITAKFTGKIMGASIALTAVMMTTPANAANHITHPAFDELPLTRLEAGVMAMRKGQHDAAFKLLTPPANHGNAAAQYGLGILFMNGVTNNPEHQIDADLTAAFHLFEKAAKQGHVGALFQLGFAYERGNGVTADITKSLFFYRLAAHGHNVNAQLNLAILYAGGKKTPQDLAQAYEWALIAQREAATKRVHPALTARIDVLIKSLSAKVSFQQRRKAGKVAAKLLGFPI